MLAWLLAQGAEIKPAPPQPDKIDKIYDAVVTNMPWGGLGLIFVLIAVTLIVCLWMLWGQRTLAANQVRIARMLKEHMAEHARAAPKPKD